MFILYWTCTKRVIDVNYLICVFTGSWEGCHRYRPPPTPEFNRHIQWGWAPQTLEAITTQMWHQYRDPDWLGQAGIYNYKIVAYFLTLFVYIQVFLSAVSNFFIFFYRLKMEQMEASVIYSNKFCSFDPTIDHFQLFFSCNSVALSHH